MTCRKKVAPSLCVAIHPWWCRRSSAIVMCRVLDMLMRSVSWSNVYLESLAAVYMPPTSPSGTEKCHKIRWSSGLDFPLRGRRWPFLNPSCSILFGFVFAWKKRSQIIMSFHSTAESIQRQMQLLNGAWVRALTAALNPNKKIVCLMELLIWLFNLWGISFLSFIHL